MPDLHPGNRRWLVVARDRDGHPTHTTNATSWVGEPEYEQRIAVLRRGLRPGHTLDTTEADAAHRQRSIARRRFDAALLRWMRAGAPEGGHPGGLADWMPPIRAAGTN